MSIVLKASDESLHAAYDLAMLDLDGVVYVGADAVPGAPEHLERVRRGGMHLAFVTNNAARTPAMVAEHLNRLGIDAVPGDVVTSAQAAAHLLATRLEPGARVFLLGSTGLEQALVAEGLAPVRDIDDEPVAVVSGYDPDLPWRRLMQGAVLIRDGLPWVASNTDGTVPMNYGLGPGHGVQVRMLSEFSGVTPTVAGKPMRPLLDETIRRVGGSRPLMVGDRLDTDIEGANGVGVDSLLVMTGVTDEHTLLRAPAHLRPSYVAADLGGLMQPHGEPRAGADGFRLGGWRAAVRDGELVLDGDGAPDDRLRVMTAAAWAHLDDSGEPVR